MPNLTISDIINQAKESQRDFQFSSKLQIIDKTINYTSSGKPYFILKMRDITGDLGNIKKWTESEEELNLYNNLFEIGNIIELNGQYQQTWNSIVINSARKLNENQFSLEEFVISPISNQERLIEKLNETISKITDKFLKSLMKNIFDDEEIKEKYYICPSSIIKHHSYSCGNLEHTLGMITAFENFIDFYQRNTKLNVDLIYTGIILHDIGKIFEYKIKNEVPSYNQDYALLDHINLGAQLITEYIKGIDGFPKDLENRIIHIILSHHGRKQWGSPIEPQFPEAEIVHYLDMIDSRFKSI